MKQILEKCIVSFAKATIKKQNDKLVIIKLRFPLLIRLMVFLPFQILCFFVLYICCMSITDHISKILIIICLVLFTYYSLTVLMNYSVVEISKKGVVSLQKPLPWFHKKLFLIEEIKDLFPNGEYWVIGGTVIYINMVILLKNKKTISFLSYIEATEAKAVERKIKEYLKNYSLEHNSH